MRLTPGSPDLAVNHLAVYPLGRVDPDSGLPLQTDWSLTGEGPEKNITLRGEPAAVWVSVEDSPDRVYILADLRGGEERVLEFETNGSSRWQLKASSSAESGGNAGSRYRLR